MTPVEQPTNRPDPLVSAPLLDRVSFRLMRALESTSLFFVTFSLSVAVLYGIGNFQDFLDQSLFMLLWVLRVSSLLSVFVTAYYLLVMIVWMVRRRILVLPRVIYALASIVLLLGVLYGVTFLESVFGGI